MDDFVTSMISTDKHKYLACTCGDGSVVSINLTARKLHIQVLNDFVTSMIFFLHNRPQYFRYLIGIRRIGGSNNN